MPVYDYLCGRCGAFTAMRPMAECEQPNACPGCGARSRARVPDRALFFRDAGGTAQGARDQREERACAVVPGSDESSARRWLLMLRREVHAQQQAREERRQELSGRSALDDLALSLIVRALGNA